MSIFTSFPASLSLTTSQRAAVYAIGEFLNVSSTQVFVLRGYAGTGKTTLMEGVICHLLGEGTSVMAMAPTGRAARILSTKTGVAARTIHSNIYKQTKVELSEDGVKRKFEINPNAPSNGTVLIVDEASMLSNSREADATGEAVFGTGKTLSDFLTFVNLGANTNTKVIFIGDDAQLLPVHDKCSPALSANYFQDFFGLNVIGASLTEVMRHDNSILAVATKLRLDIQGSNFDSVMPSARGEVSLLKHTDLVQSFVAAYPNVADAHDSIMVVASNEKAFEYNMAVREHFFPLGGGTVMVGDRMMVCANVYGDKSLMNGEMVEVAGVGELIRRKHTIKTTMYEYNKYQEDKVKPNGVAFKGFDTAEITLSFRKVQIRQYGGARLDVVILNDFLFSPDTSVSSLLRRALMVDLRERVARNHTGLSKPELDAKFLAAVDNDPYYNSIPVKFGYAITCHKAQGGEWAHVFANICTSPALTKSAAYFRWVYTAVTRASQFLTLGVPFVPNPTFVRRSYYR